MIEGLKVTVVGTELKELCLKRAEHHKQRAGVYAAQATSMEENEIGAMNYSNGDPKRAIKDKQNQHENDSSELKFIADHLIADEQYLLERADLARIGIAQRGY